MPDPMLTPRSGPLGYWDRLVGPGMTRGETALVLGVSLIGTVLTALHLWSLGLSPLLILIGALIAFDVIGGAVCNMTETTKRWFHRAGQTAKDHLGFIGLHLLHIALVAWLFRGDGFDLAFMAVIGAWLLISAALVLKTDDVLKQPLAVTMYVGALGFTLYLLGSTPGLEWFVPLLFIKLLMGHAIPPRQS